MNREYHTVIDERYRCLGHSYEECLNRLRHLWLILHYYKLLFQNWSGPRHSVHRAVAFGHVYNVVSKPSDNDPHWKVWDYTGDHQYLSEEIERIYAEGGEDYH